jgi:hypothetical protein
MLDADLLRGRRLGHAWGDRERDKCEADCCLPLAPHAAASTVLLETGIA